MEEEDSRLYICLTRGCSQCRVGPKRLMEYHKQHKVKLLAEFSQDIQSNLAVADYLHQDQHAQALRLIEQQIARIAEQSATLLHAIQAEIQRYTAYQKKLEIMAATQLEKLDRLKKKIQ